MYADLLPEVRAMSAAGQTLRAIAATLNAQRYATARGSAWTATQVMRIASMA